MWISNKEYENLLAETALYRQRCITLSESDNYLTRLYTETNEELTKCKQELEEYKQKYADEVQKRLDLMEYIDCICVVSEPNYEIDKLIEEFKKHKTLTIMK